MIKKLGLCLTVVSILLKIRVRHTQISVPKIGIPMSKTACINPWLAMFIANVFHAIAEMSSIIFNLCWQFFADAKIFEVERLSIIK